MLQKRRHVKHAKTFEERLAETAAQLKEQARRMPVGKDRESVMRRARQAETAANINKWLTSPGLRPAR